jgi:hypothetical protein
MVHLTTLTESATPRYTALAPDRFKDFWRK